MNVDPTGADLKQFLAGDDGLPFVMLNLLRFSETGRPFYQRYARDARPFLDAVGGRMLYVGDTAPALVAPDEHTWDAVMLVEYPSRAAFCSMVADPGYQELLALRTAGLSHAVLQPTTRWGSRRGGRADG